MKPGAASFTCLNAGAVDRPGTKEMAPPRQKRGHSTGATVLESEATAPTQPGCSGTVPLKSPAQMPPRRGKGDKARDESTSLRSAYTLPVTAHVMRFTELNVLERVSY
jgi:hypothetical protein